MKNLTEAAADSMETAKIYFPITTRNGKVAHPYANGFADCLLELVDMGYEWEAAKIAKKRYKNKNELLDRCDAYLAKRLEGLFNE